MFGSKPVCKRLVVDWEIGSIRMLWLSLEGFAGYIRLGPWKSLRMVIQHVEVPHHWNYFFCLEDDVRALSRWIEFSGENEAVYSIELARLLMTASAECDVVAKALCRAIDPNSRAANINAYRTCIVGAVPDIHTSRVQIPRFGKTLRPWSYWRTDEHPPLWWMANNKVKHHRAEHFKDANLKNVLNSVAGLMVLLVLLSSRDRPSLYPGPTLFEPMTYAYRDGAGIVFTHPLGSRLA